jgi:hypothetical protein
MMPVEVILKKCAISLLTSQLFFEDHSFLCTRAISVLDQHTTVKSLVGPFRKTIPEFTAEGFIVAFQA